MRAGWLAAALLLAGAAERFLPRAGRETWPGWWLRGQICAAVQDHNAAGGEALLRAEPTPLMTWSMPAHSLSAALLCRGSDRAFAAVVFCWIGVCALLTSALACWLFGASWGAAFSVYLLASAIDGTWLFSDRWLYCGSVLVAATALARWAGRPSRAAAAAAAAAQGASLLFFSTLFLLGPACAAWAWFKTRDRVAAALFLFVPLVPLAPWAALNAAATGGVRLFEHNRADAPVVGAALGRVDSGTPVEDAEWVARADGAPLRFALKEALSHPLRYLAGYLKRLSRAAGYQPALLFFALAGWALRRRDPRCGAVAAVAAYYVLIHALLTVRPHYFTPVWPLAAALAAGVPSTLTGAGEPPVWAGAVLRGAHAAALVVALAAMVATAVAAARLA